MPVLLLRTLVVYLTVLAVMRLMGKRQLGDLQPSELASTVLISNLASISIESPDAPLLASLAPILMLTALELLLSALAFVSSRAARWLTGKPIVVVRDGIPDQQAMRRLRYTMADLTEALRCKDAFCLADVAFAMVETNGSLTVALRPESQPPDCRRLGLEEPGSEGPELPWVLDGRILQENLLCCGWDGPRLLKFLSRRQLAPNQVLALFGSRSGPGQLIQKAGAPHHPRGGKP